MKRINFVDTPTQKQHRSITIWYLFSAILALGVGSTITYKQIQQYSLLQKAYSEYKTVTQHAVPFEQAEQQKKELICTQDQLNKQQCTLETIKNKPKLPTTILQTMYVCATPLATVKSCNINTQQLQLEVVADSSNHILQFIEKCEKCANLKNIQLTALHPHHKKMRATITGTINWNEHS